jgi:hypothetical protein
LPGTIPVAFLPARGLVKHLIPVALLLLAAVTFGCKEDVIAPPDSPCSRRWDYVAATSPENAIHNITGSYINLDPVEYDSTLAPGYVFRFAPADIGAGQPDSLIRRQELDFAENLFINGAGESAPKATRICLAVQVTSSGPDSRAGHASWMKCVVHTDLTLNFYNRASIIVKGPAWWYFRQVPEGSGTWMLAEWVDRPADSASGTSGLIPTWGALHRTYR